MRGMRATTTNLPVVVVRPYGERIRKHVFKLVTEAGFKAPIVIEPGVPDADAVQRVLALGVRVLVVPFNGHRTLANASVDGFSFLRALFAAAPTAPWRVLMPVSQFGAAAVEIERAKLDARFTEAVLFLSEAELELEREQDASRIGAHFTT